LGRIDVAERLVSASVRKWNDSQDRRQATLGRITLAQLHVQVGDRQGVDLAVRAINEVQQIRSTRARERLVPLLTALSTRPEPEYQDLTVMARSRLA